MDTTKINKGREGTFTDHNINNSIDSKVLKCYCDFNAMKGTK